MKTAITIRTLDESSMEWINQKAKQREMRLEEIIVQLIHDQIEAEVRRSKLRQYTDLDSLAGTWSNKEGDEFLQVIDDFNQVDEKLWQ